MITDDIATAESLASQVIKLRQSQLHAQSLDQRVSCTRGAFRPSGERRAAGASS